MNFYLTDVNVHTVSKRQNKKGKKLVGILEVNDEKAGSRARFVNQMFESNDPDPY
jgi:hypothetical protein